MQQLEKERTQEALILPEVISIFDAHSTLNGLAKAMHLLHRPSAGHLSLDSEALIEHAAPTGK